MSESTKKRKSLWDCKEESPLPDQISQKNAWHGKENHSSLHVSRDRKWSDMEANNALKSEDCLDVRYRRSRSRSRGRGRGRSRSRSWSRGRGRSRSRSRGRAVSRSRSRGRGWDRSRSRSRSPLGDRRRESYGGSDRRSGFGVSPQPCRDFAAGKCRRGSHCRFLHQDNLNHQDGGRLERDQAERCRSSRNSSVDYNYKRQARNNGNIPCKFFMMGKCQRDNCRFSHDGPAGGNLEGKSQADDRLEHDFDNTGKSWNGPKWGEATAVSDIAESTGWGKVGKGTFVDPTTAERQSGDRWGHSLDDKTKLRNGSKWSDATGVSEIAKSTGWANSNDVVVNLTDPMNADKRADDRRDHGLDNESRMWGGAVWKDKAAERDETVPPHWESGSHIVNTGISGSKNVAESFNREESPVILHGLQSQTLHGISENVPEVNIMQQRTAQQLATTVMHSVVSESSQIQQHHSKMGDNIAMTDDSNSVNRAGIYGNVRHPALVPGQNFNENVDSFGFQPRTLGGINQSQHMAVINPSNEHVIDLNKPVQHNSPSNLQNQTQIHREESVKTLVNSGMPQNVVNSEQAVQVTSFPASLTQIFGNGQLPQLYAVLNPPNVAELVCSLADSAGLLPPIASSDAQPDPATLSQKQYDPIGDSIELNKVGICNQPSGFSSLERSSPSSAVGLESGKVLKNGCPEDDFHRSPELKQEKRVTDLVVGEDGKSIAEKCKQDQENIRAGNVDADGRVGDGTNGKDEKAMRLFKIALVEFVKEILKPKWKEGQMSREVHKTIVKKVVDKVSSTIQAVNIPKTQDKIEQYLSYSKPKLTKLVEAYTERFLKSS